MEKFENKAEYIDLVKEFDVFNIKKYKNTNYRISFRVIRNRGQNWFQIVKMFQKGSWHPDDWQIKPNSGVSRVQKSLYFPSIVITGSRKFLQSCG